MTGMVWEEFWWNSITGPNYIVSAVTNALLGNDIVVLKVPSDLPWRYQMRSAVDNAFRNSTDAKSAVIDFVDAVDDCSEENPGRFLLNRYGTRETRNGYRERSKSTIQSFLIQKEVLKNRVIWVKGLAGNQADKWIKFCKGYSPTSIRDGLFVLEIHGDFNYIQRKNIQHIEFLNHVSNYDVQLFNSIILDEGIELKNDWKKYISTVAALLCNEDAEISELLLRILDFQKEDPIEGIKRIAEMPEFAPRGADMQGIHVLTYYRSGNIDELKNRIWAAQVNVLFPIIEMERIKIVTKLKLDIESALSKSTITQYGVTLTSAIDVELGTLEYMMTHYNSSGERKLNIPDAALRQRIHFLHKCRNLLAHASCCSPEQIRELLQ